MNFKERERILRERLKVGEIYRLNTKHLFDSSPLKKKHLEKCRLIYMSDVIGNYGECECEDGKVYPVLLEYLIPLEEVSINELIKEKKKLNLFDFEGVI